MSAQVVAIGAQCKRCGSTQSELRRRTISNGTIQYRWQCLNCGSATTDAIAHSKIGDANKLPEWNTETEQNYADWERRRAFEKRVEKTAFGLQFTIEDHNRYLMTPRGASFVSGCSSAPVSRMGQERARDAVISIPGRWEVHHLTYAHWKCEFLWELVALCPSCHDRVHQHDLEKFSRG